MADRGRATDWRSRDRGWCPERGPRGAGQGGGLPAARGQRREGPVSNAPEIRNVFIRRPIFSGVISIVIVLLGLFALRTLPVNSYPALTPPEIQVQAVYPGATAQDVAAAVAAPIEQQLSGLDGLLYFKSSNSSAGVMNLSVYFDVSRNPDLAAVDVQNQIALAEPQLPQEVVRNGITVQKRQTAILVVGALTADDPRFDAEYLSNYSKIYVQDELKRIPGVGDAQTVGQLEFSMLLSLDPDRMAQLGLTVSDVAAAVQEQNATNPAGRIGREPAPPGTQLTIPVITSGRLKEASDFERIIVRGRPDGSLVHLSDIGNAHLGARNYDLAGRFDGAPTALTPVFLRPGANALQVKREVVARMGELAKSFPPGVRWTIAFDTTPYVTESIKEVAITIAVSVVLSGIVALTLTPALCAVLLRPVAEGAPSAAASGVVARAFNRFFGGFNRGFRSVTERYLGTAGRVIDRPRTFFAAFGVAVVLLLVLVRSVPTGFIPSEDKGYFGMLIELPDNASRQRTEAVVKQVEGFLLRQPAIHHVVALVGLNFIQNANQTNAAIMFVMLKPWDERTTPREQFPAVLGAVNGYLFQLQQTRGFAFNLPEIIGLGTTAGLELNLQDRGVNDVTRFAGLAGEFAADANALPELRGVYPTIRVNTPQLFVQVDREKVKTLGISLSELFQTLQASLSTLYINDFNRYGKTYRVQAEAQSRFRQTPDDIGRLYVRGPNQQMVPVSALTRTEFRAGPSVITRFNGFTSALLVGAPGPGKSSGDMLAAVERLAQDKYTGRGVGYAFSRQSYQERASGGQGGLVFALGLVMVVLVLAAPYA